MKKIRNILLLFAAILALSACNINSNDQTTTENSEPPTAASDNQMMEDQTEKVTFKLTGENFKFIMDGTEAPELRVKQGDLVRIEFTSTQGFHDWAVDEFDAATTQVQTGGSTSVEFIADQKGTFEYYCSVGQHRANGMFGNLIVE